MYKDTGAGCALGHPASGCLAMHFSAASDRRKAGTEVKIQGRGGLWEGGRENSETGSGSRMVSATLLILKKHS